MGHEEKTIELTKDRDTLIGHRNNFQASLIGNILDMLRYEKIKELNPEQQIKNQQTGKFVSVDELIEEKRKGARNARSYVEIIDELLGLDADGKLPEVWAEFSEKKEDQGDKAEEAEEKTEDSNEDESQK